MDYIFIVNFLCIVVFVYGATGAGKTFTMLGNENNFGITYLTMKDLYEKVNEQQDTKKFEIYVSYLEVSIKILC